jgi:hypothetical protein|tara:strand:+ start:406 stop:753 length:348 start_codon:yes stop_codon:yes gene_type:complete
MQNFKTITKKTTTKVKSIHTDALWKVVENSYNNLQLMEADGTSASYFLNSANIFAQLQEVYAENCDEDYVSLESVMEVFANNITYYDEEYSLYESVVKNTALEKVKLQDYTCLSN